MFETFLLDPPNAAVVTAWLQFLTPIALAFLIVMQLVAARTTSTNNKASQAIASATHALVNSQHGVALETVLAQAQRISELTNAPADKQSVVAAQTAVDNHNTNQATLDATTATPKVIKPFIS